MHNAIMKIYHNWVKSFLKVACKSDKKILQKSSQKKPNGCLLIFKIEICWKFAFWSEKLWNAESPCIWYTANVYRDLQGLCGEIGVRGIQIYGDCMYTSNPCDFEIFTLWFPCKNCGDFDFTGILWGYPTLNVGKSCNKKKLWIFL